MAVLLGIETSTKICSVALSNEKGLITIKEEGGEYSHAEKLNGFILNILDSAGLDANEIAAIAVSKGPGSYTGLRIGVSTAKGLCYALNKPLIAVDTLKAMALRASREANSYDFYCPMIDARRMEVYTALYDQNNNQQEGVSAKIITEESFASSLKDHRVLFFGDGAQKCEDLLGSNENALFEHVGSPSAQYVNELAFQKFEKGEFEDVAYFEPYYLKDFIATKAKKLL